MGHPEGPTGFVHDRLARVAERLNLSEEQVDSMSAILEETMPELLEGMNTIRELRGRMREEYLKPDVNAETIQRLRRETAAVQSGLDSLMVETMLKEAEILSPEQREAYFELMPFGGKGKRGGEMRGGRMHRGRGWRGQ
jgi:Spy/CpxP family protein refolding chaperone